MACPHVAGVAALILQRNPELSVTQVNSIICCNAKKLSGVSFNEIKPDGTWNEKYGYGLVDAYSSVINTPEIVYIQNDTITGTRTIIADKIYVGRDVTDRKEKGGVILGPGNISLKAKNVIIKNSTTLPLDTRLIIGK
jgi:subtilisin family serine protease